MAQNKTPYQKLRKQVSTLSRIVTKQQQVLRQIPHLVPASIRALANDMAVLAGSQSLLIDVLGKSDPSLHDKIKAELELREAEAKKAMEAKTDATNDEPGNAATDVPALGSQDVSA